MYIPVPGHDLYVQSLSQHWNYVLDHIHKASVYEILTVVTLIKHKKAFGGRNFTLVFCLFLFYFFNLGKKIIVGL